MNIIDVAFMDLRQGETWDSPKMQSSRQFRSTLVVPAEVRAVEAARIADANGTRLIMVKGAGDSLAGLLLPAWTRERIATILGRPGFTSLTDAFEAYEGDQQARAKGFHSERLNKDRPRMYWCNAGHSVDGCPCGIPEHQMQGCTPDQS
jgi:hypothetical protein